MPGEGDVDLYRELVETKIENGLNGIKDHTEKVLAEARKDTDADLKVIKDECDQIQITLERVSTQITELSTSLRSFKENLPQAIDKHLEQRHKSWMAHVWGATKVFVTWLPTIITIIVGLIIIRAWLSGEMSPTEAALSMPL